MLNWLQRLHALLAEVSQQTTAQTPSASGVDASDAIELAIPTERESGFPQPSGSTELDLPPDRESLQRAFIAQTRAALTEAAELHFQALYGSGIMTDFVIIGETIDANFETEIDEHSLYVATSGNMTSWKLSGMTQALAKYVFAGII